ncbi:MAG: SDR family oxidoreductase [Alphaproteobacteria bacterium]|nr:SDR family oxidoreductase [Alphaproteobacteria bacterium]
MARLGGRVAIVTGGAQGIGAHYAKGLAAEGAKVAVADILDPTPVVNSIRQQGGEAIGIVADMTKTASVEAMVAKTVGAFGKLDILVNNAAIFGKLERKPQSEIDNAEWDRVIDVNVTGPWRCVRAAVPEMKKNGYGKIINIASTTVWKGVPLLLHYVTSKGAVEAFTRSLAREVGEFNICVNAIGPGLTMSENVLAQGDSVKMNREWALRGRSFKREQVPEDLVGAVLFLASPDSDFMTGQTIMIDGGEIMH